MWTRAGRPASRAIIAAAAALAFLVARPARADDAQALERARAPFDAGQYEDAHQRLAKLLDDKKPPCDGALVEDCRLQAPELAERARALDAAALLALKRTPDADEVIATILRKNPNYVPSPATFPQEVIDRFTFIRGKMAAELRKIVDEQAREAEQRRLAAQKAREDQEKWIADLQKLGSKEQVIRTNSRWIALIPFGIGQFQNGDTAGGVGFAVSEVAFAGASITMFVLSYNLASQSPDPALINPVNARLGTYATVNRITFSAWAALTAAGILHAQLTFVPEKVTYRDRPIPPRPKLVPVASPLPHGAFVGLGGTF